MESAKFENLSFSRIRSELSVKKKRPILIFTISAMLLMLMSALSTTSQAEDAEQKCRQNSIEDRCKCANDMLESGLTIEARSAFEEIKKDTEISKNNLDTTCASEGAKKADLKLGIQARCRQADEIFKSGLLREAEEAYKNILEDTDLLKSGADLNCALSGTNRAKDAILKLSVITRCMQANNILGAGLPTEAKAAYKSILEYDDFLKNGLDLSCATNGINESTYSELKNSIDGANALSQNGFEEDAKTSIKTILQSRPKPEDIETLKHNKKPQWYIEFQSLIIDQLFPIVEVSAFALALIVLTVFIARRWIFGWPTVNTICGNDADTSSLSGEFCRTLENAMLNRDISSQGSFLLVRESTAATPPDIKNIAESSWISKLPWLDAVANFIVWLIYRPPIELSGCQVTDEKRGFGVILQLHYNKRILAAPIALWEQEFGLPITKKTDQPDQTSVENIAEIGAIWLAETLASHSFTARQLFNNFRRKTVTGNWKADAFIHAGLRAHRNSELKNAKALFLRALQAEPENKAALVNLGRSLYASNEVNAEDRDRALKYLKQAYQKKDAISGLRNLQIQCAVRFNLAALQVDRNDFNEASDYANELLDVMTSAKELPKELGLTKLPDRYLELNQSAVKCLLAGCLAAKNALTQGNDGNAAKSKAHIAKAELELKELEKSTRYTDHYNLACAYSMFAMNEGLTIEDREKHFRKSKSHLKESLWLAQQSKANPDEGTTLKNSLKMRARNHDGAFQWIKAGSQFYFEFRNEVGNDAPPP